MIGILDWGSGGCDLANRLLEIDSGFIYLSDSGYDPYGRVPHEKLKARVERCVQKLQEHGASKIVIACNAASTVIEDDNILTISSFGRDIIIENQDRNPALIGGFATIESPLFKFDFEVKRSSGQKLSWHIEQGVPSDRDLSRDLDDALQPLKGSKVLLLACTHYPAIQEQIENFLGDSCQVINPMTRLFSYLVERDEIESGPVQWMTTGDVNTMRVAAKKAFNTDLETINHIEIT